MNHKRKRPKNARAGCLLCKPNKMNDAGSPLELGHAGFGKLRSGRCTGRLGECGAVAHLYDPQ